MNTYFVLKKKQGLASTPLLLSAVAVLALAGCGGGGGGNGGGTGGSAGSGSASSPQPSNSAPIKPAETYRVGGTVGGLAGQGLVLQNNAGDDLAVNASGSFTFANTLATDAGYSVTVKSQPSDPSQICTVNAGSGKVGTADIANVAITCATSSFLVGGSVSGLQGAGLVLQNNAGDDIAVDADGKFRFDTAVASGAGYAITVKAQPASPTQTCSVSKASGKVVNAAIDDVSVVCATNAYPVGGSVSGLQGSGLVLTNNTEDLAVAASSGSFAFTQNVASGADYTVSVKTQPSTPSQTCTVNNGQGTIANAGVSNVGVSCTTDSFFVKGTLTGLDGVGLVLQNNGDDITPTADGSFTFPKVASGQPYNVTVKTQPTLVTQNCTVSNGGGTIGGADVSNVSVACQSMVPRFAYLAAQGLSSTGRILTFAVDANTHAFSPLGGTPASSGFLPSSMAVDASGQFAYVTTSNGINQYNVGSDGALAPMSTPKVNAGTTPQGVTLAPNGRLAYALNADPINGKISILPVGSDGALGAAKQVAVGAAPSGFAVESSGRFVYVANSLNRITAFTVDQTNGTLISNGSVSVTGGKVVKNLTADASGRFVYAITQKAFSNAYAIATYTIAANGTLASAGELAIGNTQMLSKEPTDVTSHPSGRFAYLTMSNGEIRTYKLNANTNALEATGDNVALGSAVRSAAPDASGRFMVVTTGNGAVTYPIDHASGALGAPVVTNVPMNLITSVALGR